MRLASFAIRPGLRVFLSALAIFDDLGGILVIALFYNLSLAPSYLLLSLLLVGLAYGLGKSGHSRLPLYVMLGALLWLSFFWAGIHPTISGAVFAFALPTSALGSHDYPSFMHRTERRLLSLCNFVVLPLFALANLGFYFADFTVANALSPASIGTAAGLVFGKPLGIFVAAFLAVKLGIASLPLRCTWTDILGVSCFAGVGFTVSLFVAYLAFEGASGSYLDAAKLGVVAGSLLSALLGVTIFRLRVRYQ